MARRVLATPPDPATRGDLVTQESVRQRWRRDDRETVETLLELAERIERKAETIIQPELRDEIVPGVELLLSAIHASADGDRR